MTNTRLKKQSFRLFCALSILLAFCTRCYVIAAGGPAKFNYASNLDHSAGEEQDDEDPRGQKLESKEILYSESIPDLMTASLVRSRYIKIKSTALAISVPTQPPKVV